jgi:hypothetical protein
MENMKNLPTSMGRFADEVVPFAGAYGVGITLSDALEYALSTPLPSTAVVT